MGLERFKFFFFFFILEIDHQKFYLIAGKLAPKKKKKTLFMFRGTNSFQTRIEDLAFRARACATALLFL